MRRRSIARILTVALLVSSIASARPALAEIAFKLPPPEVNAVLPLAALPLDKPPVALSATSVRPSSRMPELPRQLVSPPPRPSRSGVPASSRAIRRHRFVVAPSVECGRPLPAGRLEPARQAFQPRRRRHRSSCSSARPSARGDSLRSAVRGCRALNSARCPDIPRDFRFFAPHTLAGGLDTRSGARPPRFETLEGRMPVVLIRPRYGRALALYGSAYAEARDGGRAPASIRLPHRRQAVWLGTLGPWGRKGASPRLKAFTAAALAP